MDGIMWLFIACMLLTLGLLLVLIIYASPPPHHVRLDQEEAGDE